MACLSATSAWAQAPAAPAPSYQFSSDGSSVCIPAEVVADGLVFVRASVNHHPGWFILDNGTQGFTVDREYAQQASLGNGESAQARGGGANAIQAGIVRDVEIGMKGLVLTHRNVVVIPLKSLEPAVGHAVDGILGSRLFDDFIVAIDYAGRCVSVYRPDRFQPSAQERAIPVEVDRHGFQYVEATIALPGGQPVRGRFLIDGGANDYADIFKPFSDAHQLPPAGMKLLDEPGTSTGGKTQSRDGRAERIEVGPYSVRNPPVTFAQDVEGLMAASDYAGSIGAQFLERFTVVFDSPGKRIFLAPNRSYTDPAEYDESGLRLHAEAPEFHRFVVTRVVPGSAAAEAGIAPGDIIESIDGRATKDLTLTEIRRMFRQPGARYRIGIVRANGPLRIVPLQLRPLL